MTNSIEIKKSPDLRFRYVPEDEMNDDLEYSTPTAENRKDFFDINRHKVKLASKKTRDRLSKLY